MLIFGKKDNNKSKKRLKINFKIKSPLWPFIVFILLGITSILFLKLAFQNEIININYNERSNHDYNVHVLKNEYFSEIIEKDKQYITSLIDYVDFKLNYKLKTEQVLDFTYTYKILGKLIIFDKVNEKNELFSKDYELISPTTESTNDSKEIYINENVRMDYNEYNNISKEFKEQFGITGEDKFVITLSVDMLCSQPGENKQISKTYSCDFVVPLTENTINIDIDINDVDDKDKFTFEKAGVKQAPLLIALTISFLSLLSLSLAIIVIIQNRKKLGPYKIWINKILKQNGHYIVKISNPVIFEKYHDIFDVIDFEELLNKARLTNKNILFRENKELETSEFSIIEDKIIYRKVYKKTDTDFKN